MVPAGGLGRDGAEARGAAHRAHRPVVHGRGQLQPVSRAHERERGREKFIIHFIKIHSERAIRNHSRYDAFLNQHGEQRAPTHGGTAGEADNVRAPAPSPRRAVARRTLCMHQCRSRECGVSAARPPPPWACPHAQRSHKPRTWLPARDVRRPPRGGRGSDDTRWGTRQARECPQSIPTTRLMGIVTLTVNSHRLCLSRTAC